MKKRFLLVCTFALSTMGLLQASSNPSLSRVYGNQFTPEISQTQSAGPIGTLDGTFGSGGMLAVASGQYAVATLALSDGSVVVLSQDASNSYVAQYTAEGAVTWSVTLTGLLGAANYIMADAQGRFYVAGSTDGSSLPWIRRVTAVGSVDGTFTFANGSSWTTINQIAQQTSGEIIVVGLNRTGSPHAQIARYNLNGSIDTTFAQSGYAILDGFNSLPTAANTLYSVVVDSANHIYVAYVDVTPTVNVLRLTPAGLPDTTWAAGSVAIVNVSDLNTVTASSLRMIIDSLNDLVLAGTVGGDILAASITSANGLAGTFANFSLQGALTGGTVPVNSDTFGLQNLVAASNGSVYLLGSDLTTNYMMVVACTSAGILNTAFNASLSAPSTKTGITLFRTGTPSTNALLYSGAIAQDGQLYVTGSQLNSGTTTPYLTRLYNTQYISQVAQFPAAQEQGILDQTFGATGTETYAGVTSPVNGLYGSLLRQKPAAAIEISAGAITAGDIVVGMNGLLNSSALSNMMFAFLNQEGAVDTAMGNSGYVTLANTSASNEFITSMIQDGSGNIYVAGYTASTTTPVAPGSTSTAAILRAYPTASSVTGTATWAIAPITGAGYEAVGVSLQNTRTLLCVATSATVGYISSYIAGVLDTTFGDGGSGTINSTSFGLNMGPCYGLAVNNDGYIYAAYVNATGGTPHTVNLVKFVANGLGLVSGFGASGIVADIFSGSTIASNNVRIGFTASGDIIVAAVTATDILVAYINPTDGTINYSTNATITGSTSLQLSKVTGVSDGTALVTFWDDAADDTMYIARVDNIAALDTTFNSQGSQQGVLPIQVGTSYTTRNATSALVQSVAGVNQGNIVVVGYESVTTSDATPMAMRVYGDLGSTEILDYSFVDTTAGLFEAAYNLTPAIVSAGAGNVIFTYPSTNVNNGKLLIGIDNGTTSIVARVNESDMSLDGTFGSSGIYTVAGPLRGISTISIDAQNNIIIGGTSGAGWAKVISNDGSSTTSFNMPANIVAVNAIYQQKSGRYIVAGQQVTSGVGILVAFQDALVSPATTLAVDASFNPLSFGASPVGSYLLGGSTGLSAMAINANDTIVVAYKNGSNVMLSEITADGNGLVSGFNSGSAITTGVTADNSGAIRLNLDGAGNIIVGGSVAASHQVTVQRFDSAGGTSTAFTNGGVVASNVATITNLGSAGVTLTQLMETTTQQTVLVGYNTAGGNGKLFAVRLAANGQLDGTWNDSPVSPDTAGVLTYDADGAIDINSASIAVNGTVLSIGATDLDDASSAPIVTKVVGDILVTQVSQDPLQSPVGTLDLTIPGGSTGSLALASLITGVPAKIYVYNTTVNSSPNGAMLIASTDSTHVYVKQLNADLSVNTNFATGTSNVVTFLATGVTVTDLYVANGTNDTTQPIYVVGYTSGNVQWAARIAVDGSSSTVISSVLTLTATGAIRQSTNSRVLISGYNGSSGAIVAYNSAMTAIDTSFGNNGNGYYTTGVATGIYAMAIDNLDRIYIAYANADGTAIIIERLLENGTAVDTTFTASVSGTYPTGVTNQIKMAIDLTNQQIVVVAQNGTGAANVLQVARLSYSGGTVAAGAINTITMTGKVLNISDLFIDSDQFIYVVGNNSTDSKAIVARIVNSNATTIALDPNYAAAVSPAPAGIANVTVGSMTATTAGMLDPDGRVYLVGSGSGLGYMGRIFNNQYYTEISNAILQGVVGTLDLTLGASTTGGIDLSTTATTSAAWNTLLAGTSKAQAIIENLNGDGSSFIAFVVSGNLIVGKLNADMKPATFGTNGLTTATIAMAAVNSITQDAVGNIIVAGTTTAPLQKIVLFNSSGVLQATFTNSLGALTGTTVAQQKSGRYIIAGSTSAGNIGIFAYKNPSAITTPGSSGALAVDLTFGPNGNNGFYTTGVTGSIDDLVIDSNDDIYCVYRDGSAQVQLIKLAANGSGLVNAQNNPVSFNSGAALATGITNATQPARIAINAAGNILVGASTTGGGTPDVKVALFNGSTGATIAAAFAVYATSTPVLTKLVGSIGSTTPNNEFYGAMYNSAPAAIAFAITSAGVLDTTGFNASTGYLSTTVESVTQVNGLAIQPDGKVVMVGYNGTTTPDPVMIRVYGYPYVSQYAQAPDLVAAGQLDTTLWPTSGAMELNNLVISGSAATTFNSLIADHAITHVYESGNGVMTFVADDNVAKNTVIFQLLKDLSLNPSFGATPGYVQLGGGLFGGTTGLFVDSLGNIFLSGNTPGGTPWAQGLSSTGVAIGFSTNAFMGSAQAISQQTTARIILAGLGSAGIQGNTNGSLVGFNTTGTFDVTFGANGFVNMGSSGVAITDIALDAYDNIITVANNSGTIILQKVTATGTATDISARGTAITGAVGNPKVVLDNNGNIVVAVATATGYVIKSYVNDNTTQSNSGNNIGSVTFSAGTTPVLGNIYATNDGKITLVGYDSASDNAIVARLVSGSGSLALDTTTFNTALTGAGTPQAGVLITTLGGSGSMNVFNDAIIHADDRIMLVGSNATTPAPYMGRVFGDAYVAYTSQGPTQGVAGTLDTSFGSTNPPTGYYSLATLTGVTANAQGKAILSLTDGGYYMALDSGSATQLIRTLASGALDTAYGVAGSGIAETAPAGTNSMMMDGSSRIVLVGTTGGAGWVQRYNSGNAGTTNTSFGSSGVINLASGTVATVAVEQTSARLVVAGKNAAGNGALFAYTSLDPLTGTTGAVDTTFNATVSAGTFTTGIAQGIYTLIADQYDRLIFATLNVAGNNVNLYRLTPTGELDNTFALSGIAGNIFGSTPNDTTQIRVGLNAAGNIVVAAHTTTGIAITSFDNGISTTIGANGSRVNAELVITSLTAPTLTALVNSADGDTLILGNQSGTNGTWIARLLLSGTSQVALDTANFNPAGTIPGIFQYAGSGTTAHIYNALTVNAIGTLGVLGYEDSSGTFTPSLLQVYDTPYTTEESQSPNSKPVGNNDVTLGVSPTSTTAKGITFFGSTTGAASSGQVARAVALQDDNNIVVAIDGHATSGSGASSIMIDMFDNDGLLNPSFNLTGQATALTYYDNQYVKDMVTFTTTTNINKAILAGYATNVTSGITGSLVMQYNLTTPGLDASFGGFDGNPSGVAFGDGYQACVIGQQTSGRVVIGGLAQGGAGLLLGYTSTGKLDTSFGNDGYQATNTGTTGIYSHAIDAQNRIVIAYNDGSGNVAVSRFLADGSGLDTSFNTTGSVTTKISGLQTGVNNNFKVVINGSGNVIVAAITGNGITSNQITVYSYASDGASTNATVTYTGGSSFPGSASSTFTIGRLLVDAQGNVIVVACDSNPTPDAIVVTRLVPALTLDISFNGSGYLTYQVSTGTTQVVTDALIHPDGRIIVVGNEQ